MRNQTVRTLPAMMLLCALVFTCAAFGQETKQEKPLNWAQRRNVSFETLRDDFRDPDMMYAPFVFWFWDQPLDADKLTSMAQVMARERLNPGYVHPRTTQPGVKPSTPLPPEQWLSDLWFKAYGSALEAAKQEGAYLGYVDEYMWPSFQAEGRVLAQHPDLKASYLSWTTIDRRGGKPIEVPASFFAVAAQLAESNLPSAPEPPVRLGAWIWRPEGPKAGEGIHFRKTFELRAGSEIEEAQLRATVDNRGAYYVNGKNVGQSNNWENCGTYKVTDLLHSGKNVVAISASGNGRDDAMILGLRVRYADDTVFELTSDKTWRVADEAGKGWTEVDFDDSSWKQAAVVADDANAAPWRIGKESRKPHTPATILSDTLRIIGSGDAFSWTPPASGYWRVYVFQRNERNTVDYLNENLGEAFIEIAHEPYAKRFADELGKTIPGVFVDNEGDYGYRLAWSPTLEKRYAEKWDRDIRLWMPLMVDLDEDGRYARARWEWFDVVTDLYAETMGSTSDWCAERGMYCIENLWEESLMWQAQYVGDYFKLSRAYSMPGNDCLQAKALQVHDFKEGESVAEFEGRRYMTELMGAGGWRYFNPTFIKQATNAVVSWGVAHIVPHAVFARRKLTGALWTPDWYNENPMFPWLHLWSDFARRACYVNSHGRLAARVLLLNPMDSVWALAPTEVFDPATKDDLMDTNKWYGDEIRKINDVYSKAIDALTDARIEFLTADRYYVRRMKIAEDRLALGDDFSFAAVILPEMRVLPRDVARKVLDFAKAGGSVYALGALPTGSTDVGMDDPEMEKMMNELRELKTFTATDDGIAALLKENAPGLEPDIRFDSGAFDMLQRRLRIDGRDFFWLANNTEERQTCTVTVRRARGEASVWNCESGRIATVNSRELEGDSQVGLEFQPLEAYWLVFDPEKDARTVEAPPVLRQILAIEGPWTVVYDPDIQPPLEHPASPPDAFKKGVAKPLEDWKKWGLDKFSGLLDYSTTFSLQTIPDGSLFLDLGEVDHVAEVWVNGVDCGKRMWPPHLFAVTDAVRQGVNEVLVRVGNLVNNSYGQEAASGLMGPVALKARAPSPKEEPKQVKTEESSDSEPKAP